MTMGRVLATWALAAVLVMAPPVLRADCPAEPADLVTREIVLQMEPGHAIEELLARHPELIVLDGIAVLRVYQLEAPTVADAVRIEQDIHDNDRRDIVDRVELHEHVEIPEGIQQGLADLSLTRTTTPGDFQAQPAAAIIHVPAARPVATGRGVIVALVDGPAALDNPETAGAMIAPGMDVLGGGPTADIAPNGLDDDADGDVDEAAHHASHAAGLIHLVAPDARLLHVVSLDDDGKGTAFSVAHGIVAAVEAGADVINVSLGIAHDAEAVKAALEYAEIHGVVVVAAAGNRGLPCVDFPADESSVIGVAGVDDALVRTAFSSHGPEVALSAPASRTISTWGDADWSYWDGTSFAAPLVAGASALLLERYPDLVPADVKRILQETAQPDANPPEMDGLMGAGVLDLGALMVADAGDRSPLKLDDLPGTARARWPAGPAGTQHDLVRGHLAELRLAGGVVDLGTLTCVADDTSLTGVDDPVLPGPGRGFFYLLRVDGASWGKASDGTPRVTSLTTCP